MNNIIPGNVINWYLGFRINPTLIKNFGILTFFLD